MTLGYKHLTLNIHIMTPCLIRVCQVHTSQPNMYNMVTAFDKNITLQVGQVRLGNPICLVSDWRCSQVSIESSLAHPSNLKKILLTLSHDALALEQCANLMTYDLDWKPSIVVSIFLIIIMNSHVIEKNWQVLLKNSCELECNRTRHAS